MHLIDTIARLSQRRLTKPAISRCSSPTSATARCRRSTTCKSGCGTRFESVTRGRQRTELLAALDESFVTADFPFRRSRVVPRLVVDLATPDGVRLDVTRARATWSDEDKLALVRHGRRLTEEALEDWAGLRGFECRRRGGGGD